MLNFKILISLNFVKKKYWGGGGGVYKLDWKRGVSVRAYLIDIEFYIIYWSLAVIYNDSHVRLCKFILTS